MKEPARDIKNYRTDLSAALEDTFQRRALDKFAVDYRASRERIYSGLNDRELIAEVAARKDESVRHLDELFVQFKEEAEKRGVQVHLARDAADANRIIAKIAEDNGCKMVVKSKSMTVEEIQTNTALEAKGMEVVETDLAEWIIQLRHEGPSHMVMPAIHLSRTQVAIGLRREAGVDLLHLALGKVGIDDICQKVFISHIGSPCQGTACPLLLIILYNTLFCVFLQVRSCTEHGGNPLNKGFPGRGKPLAENG